METSIDVFTAIAKELIEKVTQAEQEVSLVQAKLQNAKEWLWRVEKLLSADDLNTRREQLKRGVAFAIEAITTTLEGEK